MAFGIRLLSGALGLSLLSSASALDLAGLEAARERAATIDKMTALLADESASVRLAVFEAVMKEDDPVLRARAYEMALGSKDEQLQTAALRQLFQDRKKLLVEVTLPPEPTPTQVWLHKQWVELVLSDFEVDKSNDEISGIYATVQHRAKFDGQLVRGGLRLRLNNMGGTVCTLLTRGVTGTTISGALECSINADYAKQQIKDGASSASLPIKIRLS